MLKKKIYLIPIFLYFAMALLWIEIPGINSDEILFGNGAVGLPNSRTHVFKHIGHFPVMLMAYIGALKAWIYAPIFKIFGVTVYSLRLPMIFLTGLSLYFSYRIMFLITRNNLVSFFCLLFLSTHTTLILLTRTDQGPVAIELFLKTFSIFLLLSFFRSSQVKWLYLVPGLLALGAFNKLNFIWISNAVSLSLIIFLKDYLQISKKKGFEVWFWAILSLWSPVVIYLIISKMSPSLSSVFFKDFTLNGIVDRVKVTFWGVENNFQGHFMLWAQYPVFSMEKVGILFPSTRLYNWSSYFFFLFTGLNILFLIISFFRKTPKSFVRKAYYFFWLMVGFVLVQQFLVPNANAGWHFFTIYPMLAFVFYLGLYLAFPSKIILISTSLFFLLGQFNNLTVAYSTFLNGTPKNVWSPKIMDLTQYLKTENRKIVQLTWGTDDQLTTFLRKDEQTLMAGYEVPDSYYTETDGQQRNPEPDFYKTKEYIYQNYIKNDFTKQVYVLSWEENLYFIFAKAFFKAVEDHELEAVEIKAFYDDVQKVYSVFELRPKILNKIELRN